MSNSDKTVCPNSTGRPPGTVDADGFRSDHGWDCVDFGQHLRNAHGKEGS